MHFISKPLIWWCFIFWILFWHYFDIFLESTYFIFSVWETYDVISKIHYESIIFLEFIPIFYDDLH